MMLVSLLVLHAAHAGLRVQPDAPPVALGGDRFAFGEVELNVLPAVILSVEPGALPPAGAEHLGGPSWRVPVADPAAAVALALRLDAQPGLSAFPDVMLERTVAAFDDPLREGQWYLDHLDMEPLYARSLGDPAIRVAVIDSGIDARHADLIDGVADPYDAFDDDDDPAPEPGAYCYDGSNDICDEHGTAVSGVVAARANNGVGMVGLCPQCTLIPIKLLGEGAGALGADIAAFEHAIAADAAVINNSWGYTRPVEVPQVLADVIARAATEPRGGKGALVVFAAGNDDREVGMGELQALDSVLCVTATDSYGRYTNYTNYGEPVDLAAPSATVSITPNGGTTTTFGGTSAAAPVVSGLAGWALSVDPSLDAAGLRALLLDTARPSPLVTHDPETGHHPYYGYGEVDPAALLAALDGDPGDADPAPDPHAEAEDEAAKGGCAAAPVGGAAALLALVGVGAAVGRRRP